MKTIKDLKDIKNKNVIVRVDYNVPLKNNKIIDAKRIEASFETIKYLQKKGARVLLLAHLGEGSDSLRPIAKYLTKYFKTFFITENINNTEKILSILKEIPTDAIVLFENIRQYEGEQKNDIKFAKTLSKLGDIFVNDAFSVSHRKHASVVGVAKYLPSYAGIQLEKEIKNLSPLLENKKHPFVFILGGAKFGTKIPLINRFLDKADSLVIAGAIVNSFYKTAGFEVGNSVIEDGYEKQIKKLLSSPNILLPVDVVVLRDNKKKNVSIDDVSKADTIVDIGFRSVELISEKIKKAKVVVWNGPTGWYEKGFVKATKDLALAMKDMKGYGVIGGGDTGAVVEKTIGSSKKVFISTGGGATLDFLANGTLVGVQLLK